MEQFIAVMKKYWVFEGRASRPEYWIFTLVFCVVYIALIVIETVLSLPEFTSLLFCLVTALPSLAVGARRLHDTNRSGWWQLLAFLPIVGWIILIVFLAQAGQAEENQYGQALPTQA